MRRALVVVAVFLVAAVALADGSPWRARRVRGVRPNFIATARVTASEWPAEPPTPAVIDPNRFADALERLCGWMPQGRPLRYADFILRYSAEFGEDPFLVGALIYTRTLGSCRPDHEGPGGVGLTEIDRDLHAPFVRRGVYRFQVRDGGRWVERERRMDRFPFGTLRMQQAEENIYFAAALLSVWREQHASVDEAFDQVPHRHHVSHFVWGDRVRSDRDEDRVLTDRRRLLEYYGVGPRERTVSHLGVRLGCPLDGAPRVVSSGIGSERDGGERSHRGIDLESLPGEPVRAVADGRVIFAGVDLPGRQSNRQMSHDEYDSVPRRELGRGGRYVCILHATSPGGVGAEGTGGPRNTTDEGPLRSCYMHLETVEVEHNQEVRRGDRIGTVGRTGMESSAAHLHLELHTPTRVLDPAEILHPIVIGDPNPPDAEVRALMGG